ncbi:hypothetical protein RY831_00800 [Noviherbaspirillum sp. CPCC 100848]|uniref:Uncharacterized protein n=1 Tax=Noviherbaspirillum album TaxID=3080276 RepID=A0ABU6J2M3_9BURK|nr:hypothetical protein [Noviherbaspirillum sp. CPCC 100848]MEC4717681.1 hypothetical protein [Noviherbaspirillum sp. CPCC 100848]
MQTLLAIAAVLAVLTGIAHSVLGELLIFRHLRQGTLVPAEDAPPLRNRHIRILWATWHLATVFGCAFAAMLARLAVTPHASFPDLLAEATIAAYAGGSLLVLIGTRGRHPGWFALAAVAALTWTAIGRV